MIFKKFSEESHSKIKDIKTKREQTSLPPAHHVILAAALQCHVIF